MEILIVSHGSSTGMALLSFAAKGGIFISMTNSKKVVGISGLIVVSRIWNRRGHWPRIQKIKANPRISQNRRPHRKTTFPINNPNSSIKWKKSLWSVRRFPDQKKKKSLYSHLFILGFATLHQCSVFLLFLILGWNDHILWIFFNNHT